MSYRHHYMCSGEATSSVNRLIWADQVSTIKILPPSLAEVDNKGNSVKSARHISWLLKGF